MKLHTVFITYNRLELTKRAIESYLDTVTLPFTFIVVDNGSTDGTADWIQDSFPWGAWERNEDGSQQSYYWLSPDNLYPGAAANEGWDMLECTRYGDTVKDYGFAHTHLHRADNDWAFLPGWCDEVEARFAENPRLGQLGMRTDEQEQFNARNVGGNCIITRQIWDEGLRYDERPWPKIKAPGFTEDSYMSPKVLRMGWEWGRVRTQCIESLADEDPQDPYYRKSWEDRKILKQSLRAYGIEE